MATTETHPSVTPARPPRVASDPLGARKLVFIHSKLDDAGLNPGTFRVYCHLARRANGDVAWPGIKSMARTCRLHPQTVRKAIKELTHRGMVRVVPRAGDTSHYHLTPHSRWNAPADKHPSESDSHSSDSQAPLAKPIEDHPCEADAAKGNPEEGNPKKVIHSLAVARDERVDSLSSSSSVAADEQVAVIYAAYPRQEARKPALQAIKRALRKLAFDELLQHTQQFAKAWSGATPEQLRYCRNPARWFDDECFADDPHTWGPRPTASESIAFRIRNLETLIDNSPANERGEGGTAEDYRELRRWKRDLERLRKQLAKQVAEPESLD